NEDAGEEGCGNYVVVGDKAELKKLAGKLPKDIHKPWIDEITIKCDKCGKQMKRVPDILDVWVDAGCTSWICLDYPQKKELFDSMFPADFILEGKDQIRGWFNLLFVASMISMGKPSFKAVYMHGFVNDSQGRKMSKSLGNYILPEEVVDKYGADAFRYYSISGTNAGLDLNYNFDDVKIKFKNLGVLWNLQNFLLDLKKQNIIMAKQPKLSIEEQYMLSKLNSTIKRVTEKFENFELDKIPVMIEELFLDLSRTYIQLVRDKVSMGNEAEKGTVMYTIFNVLLETLKIFAPTAPFITEMIYQNLKKDFKLKEESIHHVAWPAYDEKMINPELEAHFDVLKQSIQAILSAREKSQLGLRWPLKTAFIITSDEEVGKAVSELGKIIKTQANVKELVVQKDMPGIKRKIKADFAKIGPEFGAKSAKVIANFSMMPPEAIFKRIEEQGYYDIKADDDTFRITKNHLIIEKEVPQNLVEAGFKYGEIYIDLERTPELEAEGFAREVMRHVQQMRKEAGMQKLDRIELYVQVNEELSGMLQDWDSIIKEKVGAEEINLVSAASPKQYKSTKEVKVKGKTITLGLEKV
ncbi:MAG: class I tRNA ligase family protein, partial [Nanoarchaeota archaeon]|nr:class I tRNA ligase family protein [Nanoarchaeota archaeon]